MTARLKKRCAWLASAGLLALLLVASISIPAVKADGPPGLPHQFYGNVTVNGATAPAGTTVYAYVNGTLNATTTVDSLGRYGYSPIFTVTGTNGQTVTFAVGGAMVSQTATYSSGNMTRLDLTSTTTSLAVSTSAASSVASTTATLNGNLTNMGGAGSVNVYFQYGLTTSYGSTTSTQAKTSAGTFSAAISSLTPSTTYHCRAVATTGSTTVYGGDVQFTTTTSALSVTTNDATSVTTTSATLNGNLNDLGGASSASVYFEYGTTTSYGSTTTAQTKTSIGSFNTALSSLLSNTTYHCRAVATAGGNTVYGSDMSFTTPIGSLAVTTGSASAISCSSATLNGTLSSLGTNSSVNVYFQYGTTTSYGSTTSTQSLSSAGSFNASISGLSPSTTYHFRAVAAGSTTVSGSDMTFTTPSCGGGSTVPPHQFYGRVYVNGVLASSGTTVAAYVNGAPAASTTTDSLGRYGWTTLFLVPGTSGGTVTFYVGGTLVPQTASWMSGGFSRLNLYSAQSTLTLTCSATYATTTSATLSGTVTSFGPGDTSAAVSFEWGTSPSALTTVTASPSTVTAAGQSFTATRTALTAGTTYYYRAKAVGNASGTVYCPTSGTNQYIHNPSGSLAVTTGSATYASTTTATLGGTLSSLGTDTSATVSIEYGLTTSYGSTTTPQSMSSTGAFTGTATALTLGQTYHYRAKAVGSPSGTPAYGSDATYVHTPGALAVTTGSATYASSTTATLGGTLSSLGTDTSATVSIEYGLTTSYGSTTTSQSMSSTGAFTGTATGLTVGQTYHYRAKAVGSPSGTPVYGSDATYVHTPIVVLTITTTCLPAAILSSAYSATLTASGGTLPYTWSIVSGSLPTGLGLNGSTGGISGTPNKQMAYTFTVRVTDAASATATKVLSLIVNVDCGQILGACDAIVEGGYGGNTFSLFQYQPLRTASVVTMKVKGYSSGSVKVAIYANNNGEPGALLGQGEGSVTENLWSEISIASTPVTAGECYWLACISGTRLVGWNNQVIAPSRHKEGISYSGFSFPNPAGTGFASATTFPTGLMAGY